jgi:hypothetical protein
MVVPRRVELLGAFNTVDIAARPALAYRPAFGANWYVNRHQLKLRSCTATPSTCAVPASSAAARRRCRPNCLSDAGRGSRGSHGSPNEAARHHESRSSVSGRRWRSTTAANDLRKPGDSEHALARGQVTRITSSDWSRERLQWDRLSATSCSSVGGNCLGGFRSFS